MKKITLLVSNVSQEQALKALRESGVMHITPLRSITSDDTMQIEERAQAIMKTLLYLPESDKETRNKAEREVTDIAEEILALQKQKEEQLLEKEHLMEKLTWYEEWGKVSLRSLSELQAHGLYIKFYATSPSNLNTLPEDKEIFILKKEKSIARIALISKDPDEHLDLKQEIIPDMELQDIKSAIYQCNREVDKLDKHLLNLSAYRKRLQEYEKHLLKQLEFEQVRTGMAVEEAFSYLQGYVPTECVEQIKTYAREHGWAYIIDDPGDEDEPPTLIKNPKWLNIVRPIFSLMGTIPGYREFDISFWFMLFFTLFVAILIGDAGYGGLFIIIAALVHIKIKKITNKDIIYLLYVLGFSTLIWGTISGTWFGYENFSRIPFLRQFIIPDLASFDVVSGFNNNQHIIMSLCLLIGAIHLTFAHGIIVFKVVNSPRALGQLGWIGIVWGLYFVAGLLVLGKPLPDVIIYILSGSAVLALFFTEPKKNILKTIASALGVVNLLPFILSMISSFSDVVSYLRLFAVGYASVIVAHSFNAMALGKGVNSLAQGIQAGAILVAGHSLNIVLGVMALVVHGIRLNMLEFSGHLSMEWSGRLYKPFKE